jgi:hypothetical protein
MVGGEDGGRWTGMDRQFRALAIDATDPPSLERFFRDLPEPIDHVMVTAGRPHYGRLLDMDLAEARRGLDERRRRLRQAPPPSPRLGRCRSSSPLPAVFPRQATAARREGASGQNGAERTQMEANKRSGAGDGLRTRYLNLGKVALYRVSYSRPLTFPHGSESVGAGDGNQPAPRIGRAAVARLLDSLRPEMVAVSAMGPGRSRTTGWCGTPWGPAGSRPVG